MSQERFDEIKEAFKKLKEEGYSFVVDPRNKEDKVHASITIYGMPNQKYGVKFIATRDFSISPKAEMLSVWEQWLKQTNECIELLGPVLKTVMDPFEAITRIMQDHKQGREYEGQGVHTVAGKSPGVPSHT